MGISHFGARFHFSKGVRFERMLYVEVVSGLPSKPVWRSSGRFVNFCKKKIRWQLGSRVVSADVFIQFAPCVLRHACAFHAGGLPCDCQARTRTKRAADRVLNYGEAAQALMRLLPPGGRATKARRTVGRLAETLTYGGLVAMVGLCGFVRVQKQCPEMGRGLGKWIK